LKRLRLAAFGSVVVLLLLLFAWRGHARQARRTSMGGAGPTSTSEVAGPTHDEHAAPSQPISAEPEKRIHVTVRDLADGSPVPALAMWCARSAGGNEVMTNANGRLAYSPSGVGAIRPSKPTGWRSAGSDPEEAQATGQLWVYRMATIHGVVRATEGAELDPAKTRVMAHVLFDRAGGASSEPWTRRWLGSHNVTISARLGRVDEQGGFQGRVPNVRGVNVSAAAPGCVPATVAVPITAGTLRYDVVVDLRGSYRVRGVLRATDGSPLAGEKVFVYSVLRSDADSFDPDAVLRMKPTGGMTARRSRKENWATATYRYMGRTDASGRFDIPIGVEGDVVIQVLAKKHAPITRELGRIRGNVDAIVLEAQASEETVVRLYADGKPLRSNEVHYCDMTILDEAVQHWVVASTDAEGRLRTTWLIPGREYFLECCGPRFVRPSLLGRLRWKGQKRIDVRRDLKLHSASRKYAVER
jgi:uncharacterized protein YndB with AHSA1/START domain